MPTSQVYTPHEEKLWRQAKAIADKSLTGDARWRMVSKIYQTLKKKHPEIVEDVTKAASLKLTKLAVTLEDGVNHAKHEKYYNDSEIWKEKKNANFKNILIKEISKVASVKLVKLAADATWADGINSYKHEKYYNDSKIWDEYGIERPAFIGDPERRDNAAVRITSEPGKRGVISTAPYLSYGVDNPQDPFKMHQTMAHEVSHASRLQPGMSSRSVFGDASGPANYLRNRIIEESHANLDALESTAKNYPVQTLSKLPTELIKSESSYLSPILKEIDKFNTKTKETLVAGGVPEAEALERVNNQWRGESFNKRLDNFINNELKK